MHDYKSIRMKAQIPFFFNWLIAVSIGIALLAWIAAGAGFPVIFLIIFCVMGSFSVIGIYSLRQRITMAFLEINHLNLEIKKLKDGIKN
ncbi:MAG: hypothetical protein ACFFC7_33615 [Candidatus Hermodarchaeota archaeon]